MHADNEPCMHQVSLKSLKRCTCCNPSCAEAFGLNKEEIQIRNPKTGVGIYHCLKNKVALEPLVDLLLTLYVAELISVYEIKTEMIITYRYVQLTKPRQHR